MMKGSSGARLNFKGGWVLKTCPDAIEQNDWFSIARNLPTTEGLRVPESRLVGGRSYEVEFIDGVLATHSSSTLIISTLVDQILLWEQCHTPRSLTWSDYLHRLYNQHILPFHDVTILQKTFEFVSSQPIIVPATFAHGDLTLENVIITSGQDELVVIDPNFKPDLFQSYLLDFGKLLQSTHSRYHQVFGSHHGVDLTPHNELAISNLRSMGVLREALVTEITHIIRLRKYQPFQLREKVDILLEKLTEELRLL